MTISEYIGHLCPIGTYNITFEDDETQFFVTDVDDLQSLWEDFCAENDLDPEDFRECYLVQNDVDILEEFLERTTATIYKDFEWHVCEGGANKTFETWLDLIRYMDEQNEEMRY